MYPQMVGFALCHKGVCQLSAVMLRLLHWYPIVLVKALQLILRLGANKLKWVARTYKWYGTSKEVPDIATWVTSSHYCSYVIVFMTRDFYWYNSPELIDSFNSLSPVRCGCNFLCVISKHIWDWLCAQFLWNCHKLNATILHYKST